MTEDDLDSTPAGPVEGSGDPASPAALIRARRELMDRHLQDGEHGPAQRLAERLVDEYLEHAPPGAQDDVLWAAFTLGELRDAAQDFEGALGVLRRILDAHDADGTSETAILAHSSTGWVLGRAGRQGEAVERYQLVIDRLKGARQPWARREVSNALVRQANLLLDAGRVREAHVRCWDLLGRFVGDEDPEIQEHLSWAREVLDAGKSDRRRLFRRK